MAATVSNELYRSSKEETIEHVNVLESLKTSPSSYRKKGKGNKLRVFEYVDSATRLGIIDNQEMIDNLRTRIDNLK